MLFAKLVDEFHSIERRVGMHFRYWELSTLARHPALYIPIAEVPNLNCSVVESPEFKETGLVHFFPISVSKHNCASTDGNLNLMLQFLASFRCVIAAGEYPFLRVDVALYMKWLQVDLYFALLL